MGGTSGVFAVEARVRSTHALNNARGHRASRVGYRSGETCLPKSTDSDSIPQIVRQAKWLSRWLSSATGDSVGVSGVLVLLGWFIDLKQKPPILILASGNINRFFTKAGSNVLSAESVTRIVHQLEQKVRDLEPGELVKPLRMS